MPFSNGVISIFANIHAHDCIIAGCGVNVLCRAFFISTYLESSILKLVKKGVNALYRAFFISTSAMKTTSGVETVCVNALYRAFFISTCLTVVLTAGWRMCVNALYRAFFISTNVHLSDERWMECVNALYRAFFISTKDGQMIYGLYCLCQCPISGFLHFYPDLWEPLILRGCRHQFCKPIWCFS